MNVKKKNAVLYMVQAAVIAALYVVMNYAQEMIIPMSTSGPVQVRLSELLCVLAAFIPAAIPGLTVGCLLSNIVSVGVLPLDMVIGTAATLLAALCAYALRNVKIAKIPVLSLIMPVLFNGVFIGLEIEIFYIEGGFTFSGFALQGGLVALGEFIACVVIGIPFYLVLRKLPIFKNM